MKLRRLLIELCEGRLLLSASGMDSIGSACELAPIAMAAEAEPQFRINQSPRLQIGNAPLVGTPADTGFDQVEVLWQTVEAGGGQEDTFVASIRDAESADALWGAGETLPQIVTGVGTRIVHSVRFAQLQWNHRYEYRVQHVRAGAVIDAYQAEFKTRLAPGDPSSFTFAAYGDSAEPGEPLAGFRSVQRAINASDAEFSVLLGDNIYSAGTHDEADARFDPTLNPEATAWIASHIDYFAIGNHDNSNDGKASYDSFSMPLPVAGENAFVSPPAGEFIEAFGSFDYGDVHFVTFDSNSAELSRGEARDNRLAAQVDFIAANLEASDAKWKLLYMHHPLVGSLKLNLYPDTNYLEILLPRLVEAGVDLIMSGDSHTFAWSYPIHGLNDQNGNQEIADSEVEFDDSSAFEFLKGVGPIHLISGAGGRNVRNDPFGQPFIAQAHSTHAATHPAELGFARVHVTQQELTVQYISAETGQIVGDHNQNGLRDEGEEYFAEFHILDASPRPNSDLNGDGRVDALDLDQVCSALLAEEMNARFDFNQDDQVNELDHQYFVSTILETTAGDGNLDGLVNSSDLVLAFQGGRYEAVDDGFAGWREGDWNCDGRFDSSDLVDVFKLGVYQP